jgi:hypothetical protein
MLSTTATDDASRNDRSIRDMTASEQFVEPVMHFT